MDDRVHYHRTQQEFLLRRWKEVDGLELKVRRVRAGLTLWALGQRCGLHASRLSEMERGHRPVSEAVVRVLEELLLRL